MANTKSDILSRMLGNIPVEYDKSDGSVIKDILTAAAIEIEGMYSANDSIADRYYIDTATGHDLDRKLNEYAFARKEAAYALGVVVVTGYSNTIINSGDKVASSEMTFEFTEGGTIGENGVISLPVQCCTAGTAGNVGAGEINKFPITLSKVISVYNVAPCSGGTDRETDAEYRQRFYDYMSHPHTSGNKYDYEDWAMAVNGVGKAKCIPLWNGKGTVGVVIWNSDLSVADSVLVDTVRGYIMDKKPIGAELTVVSVTPVNISISCTVVFADGIDAETAKTEIQNQLSEYLRNTQTVKYSKIFAIISGNEDVSDCTDLTVNGGMSNIEITDEQTAILEGITYG